MVDKSIYANVRTEFILYGKQRHNLQTLIKIHDVCGVNNEHRRNVRKSNIAI